MQFPLQAAEDSVAVAPKVPPGQGVHVEAPARLYLPAVQPSWVADVDPAGQAYPAVQFPLQAGVEEPPVPKVPAGHAATHVPAVWPPRLP